MIQIQKLPESTKKVIFWSIITIISLGLFVFYIKNAQKKIESFEMIELKEDLPKFETPKFEMPESKQEKEDIEESEK